MTAKRTSESGLLLEVANVFKSFREGNDSPETPVLRNVSLLMHVAETAALVGPSGSGKSTLLNLIGTLDKADKGVIKLDGQDLTRLSEKELAQVRSRDIGLIFQLHHLLPQCTVWENVLVPTLALPPGNSVKGGAHTSVPEQPELRAKRLLERVGLLNRLTHRPGQLSGGERQRVAVVRALINSPKLLLADEPTGALDARSAENLADLLLELNREEKVAVLLVTHAPELAARMGTVYQIQDGTVSLQ